MKAGRIYKDHLPGATFFFSIFNPFPSRKKMSTELSLKDRIVDAIRGFRGQISTLSHEVSSLRAKNGELTRRATKAEQQLQEIAKVAGVEG